MNKQILQGLRKKSVIIICKESEIGLNKIWLAFMSSSEKNIEFSFPEYCYLSMGNFRTEPIKSFCNWIPVF